jgi:outer membrane receptor protein involved in Fe transport
MFSLLRATALLTLLSVAHVISFASSGLHPVSIQGKVMDAAVQQGMAGATVRLLDSPRGTFTDDKGEFQFVGLNDGNYRIAVSFLGYRTDTIFAKVGGEKVVEIEVRMVEAPTELAAVDISSGTRNELEAFQPVDLRMRPVNSSQDLLRLVPGVLIAQHAGGGKAEQIFMRGFDLDHGTDVLVTVDDMPVNMVSHAHGQGYADLHFLIPETVQRLDIGKGPYKASDGNLATAGAIGFVTRDRFQGNLVKVEAGQFGTRRGLAILDLGPKKEGATHGGYVAGEYTLQDGYFESPQDLRRFNLFAKYGFDLNSSSHLSISASAFQSDWNASGQIPIRAIESGQITRWGAIDDTEGGQTSRYNANLRLTSDLSDGSQLSQRIFLTRYAFDLYSNFTFFLHDAINGDQIWQTERRTMVGYQGKWSKSYLIGNREASTTIGWGFRDDAVDGIGLSRTLQRQTVLEYVDQGDVRETNAFAYLDQNIQLSERLLLNAALRYDAFKFRYDDQLDALYRPQRAQKGILSPKATLRYTATDNLQLYVRAGSGFHSNDTRVVVRQEDRKTLPRAFGAETGILFKPVPRMLLNAAVWGLELEQEFVYVGDEGIVEPSGRTRRVGLDLSWRYQLTTWLFADADFNFSRPRSTEEARGEQFIPLSPTFTSIGGLSVETPFGLTASLRYRHLSPRPANEDWTLTAEGYTLLDASVAYEFKKRFTLGISAANLLNTQWNEAQFETESRLYAETEPVSEIHFTPGAPFFLKTQLSVRF